MTAAILQQNNITGSSHSFCFSSVSAVVFRLQQQLKLKERNMPKQNKKKLRSYTRKDRGHDGVPSLTFLPQPLSEALSKKLGHILQEESLAVSVRLFGRGGEAVVRRGRGN